MECVKMDARGMKKRGENGEGRLYQSTSPSHLKGEGDEVGDMGDAFSLSEFNFFPSPTYQDMVLSLLPCASNSILRRATLGEGKVILVTVSKNTKKEASFDLFLKFLLQEVGSCWQKK